MYACMFIYAALGFEIGAYTREMHTYIHTYIGWRNSLRSAEREGGRPNPDTLALCSEASKQRTWQFNGKGW